MPGRTSFREPPAFLHDFPAGPAMDALSMAHGGEALRRAARGLVDGDTPLALRLGLRLSGRPMPPGFAWERLLTVRLSVLSPSERAAALLRLAAALNSMHQDIP